MTKQRKKRKALWPRILLIIVLLLGIAGIGTFLYIRMNLEPVGNTSPGTNSLPALLYSYRY